MPTFIGTCSNMYTVIAVIKRVPTVEVSTFKMTLRAAARYEVAWNTSVGRAAWIRMKLNQTITGGQDGITFDYEKSLPPGESRRGRWSHSDAARYIFMDSQQ